MLGIENKTIEFFKKHLKSDGGVETFIEHLMQVGQQNVHTPFELCREIVGKLKENTDISSGKIAVLFNVEFLQALTADFGVDPKNIVMLADDEVELEFCKLQYGMKIGTNLFKISIAKTGVCKMKFDCVIMNPPYQSKSDANNRKTQAIWDKFITMAFDICKDNGYVACVNPSGWRNFNGQFKEVGGLLKSKQVEYLDINDINKGLMVFGVQTSFDWWIAKNCNNNTQTTVKDQERKTVKTSLRNMPFIPNGMIEKIVSLIAKNGEEKCNIMKLNDYHTQKINRMQELQDSEFKYPCIYSITKGDKINLWYANAKVNNHFIPKVIWSNGSATSAIVDKNGKYGLTQFAYAITDDKDNLEGLAKALNSEEFEKINKMCNFTGTPGNPFASHNVFALFRKNFWKDFV